MYRPTMPCIILVTSLSPIFTKRGTNMSIEQCVNCIEAEFSTFFFKGQFLKPTVLIRPSVPPCGSHKCLRHGIWSTLRTLKEFICMLTYFTSKTRGRPRPGRSLQSPPSKRPDAIPAWQLPVKSCVDTVQLSSVLNRKALSSAYARSEKICPPTSM